MGVPSLVQPSLNSSTSTLTVFPPPIPPDVFDCGGYYALPRPPATGDCVDAFNLLPQGDTPLIWTIEPTTGKKWKYGQQKPTRPQGEPHELNERNLIFKAPARSSSTSPAKLQPSYLVPRLSRLTPKTCVTWRALSCISVSRSRE